MPVISDRCLLAVTGVRSLGGGIAAANRLALSALLESGYQVDVIALNEPSSVVQDRETVSSYRGMGNNKVAFAVAVWHSVLRNRYQLIFCDHVNLALVLAPLSLLHLCRYVVRLNGIEVFPENLNWEGKLGLRSAHQRLAISDHTREKVLLDYPMIDIQVCDLSLDAEQSHQLSVKQPSQLRQLSLTSILGTQHQIKNRMILHVGRMSAAEQYKGQDILIQAMPAIQAGVPDAQLVLVGRGDDSDRLLALARGHSQAVQQSIFMTGFVSAEELEQLYQTCYVFAMPSRGEGFGLVYLEAMAHAKPCIGSRVDAARCIVQHGETGLLADDPTDAGEVAKHVIDLLRNPELAHTLGINGYERLMRYFLFPHFMERFIRNVQK